MHTRHITLGIAVLLLTGLVSTATAGDQHRNENKAETKALPWRAELSGSFINTQSDTNKDGNKGGTNDGGFKSTLGSGTFKGVDEFAPSGTGTCPNGNPGFMATLLPGASHTDAEGCAALTGRDSGSVMYSSPSPAMRLISRSSFSGGNCA